MSKYQLIDPGIDPTDEPNSPPRRGGWLFWLAGAGLAVLIIGYLVIGKSSKAQAAAEAEAAANDAIAATIAALPTATIPATATSTQIQGGAWLPDHLRATITPTAGGISTATGTPAALVQTQIVEVTRLVPGPVVPVVTIQTVIITSTPEPTYTPWIITVVVEVTPTPTATVTPMVVTSQPIRTIPPYDPREEPTITPTSTP